MSIEAMKQALEALEDIFGKNKVDVGAITSLRQAIEQAEKQAPVQEPVAYWIPKAKQFFIADPSGRPFAKAWEPLYTAPQPQRTWVGLTGEEMATAWAQSKGDILARLKPFARAIEAKLKEKNNG